MMGLLVLLLHEAAHAVTALWLGIAVKRIGISWKGVYIVRDPGPPMANLIITLAGPIFNLSLGMAWPIFREFAMLNLIFALANLMPVAGSDGQRALTLLPRAFPRKTAERDIGVTPDPL